MSQATASAGGIAELDAERQRERSAYGEGALIVCDRVVRIYAGDGIEVQALQGLDLLVAQGELTAVIGASGSGKSTLMNILAGLDRPTAGTVRVDGHDLGSLTGRERLAYRRGVVGFIWQQTSRNLLPYLTGQQNVLLPMRLAGAGRRDRMRRANELLDALGVANCAQRIPEQMSGGEQQRTAIATALANRPRLLLADEPTGELDTASAHDVFTALQTANAELGATVLVVTHDPAVSAQVRRTIAIRDGRTSSETLRHGTAGAPGQAAPVAVEYAVLDRAGRVQLPSEMTARLGMRDRVRLQEQPDHIRVWPDRPAAPPGGLESPPGTSSPAAGRTEMAASPAAASAAPAAAPLVTVCDVARTFGRGGAAVHALRGVSFNVPVGQLVAVRGRSGCGKTTLLNIVGGLDAPTSGTVRVAGREVTAMTERERLLLRRSTVAFIFQSFGLIPTLSAAENVGIPLRITGTEPRVREERVRMLLSVVGLDDHAEQRPNELSGGEQQRVAIARALAGRPELLIADEPTGQLDSETGRQVMRLLQTVVRSEGITALVATHDAGIVDLADEVLTLDDGKMVA
jgi:ABC-type lipoprotein export system ATPase subunit